MMEVQSHVHSWDSQTRKHNSAQMWLAHTMNANTYRVTCLPEWVSITRDWSSQDVWHCKIPQWKIVLNFSKNSQHALVWSCLWLSTNRIKKLETTWYINIYISFVQISWKISMLTWKIHQHWNSPFFTLTPLQLEPKGPPTSGVSPVPWMATKQIAPIPTKGLSDWNWRIFWGRSGGEHLTWRSFGWAKKDLY